MVVSVWQEFLLECNFEEATSLAQLLGLMEWGFFAVSPVRLFCIKFLFGKTLHEEFLNEEYLSTNLDFNSCFRLKSEIKATIVSVHLSLAFLKLLFYVFKGEPNIARNYKTFSWILNRSFPAIKSNFPEFSVIRDISHQKKKE